MAESKVELLIAWDDNTWTTEIEEVPFSFDHPDFETAVMTWVHSPEGMIGQRRFRTAVMFAMYNISPDEEES